MPQNQVSKNMNFWPYVIVIMLILSTIASVWTIDIAIKNPVQDANILLDNYHKVDKNINEILISNIEFNKKYELSYTSSKFEDSTLNLKIKVLEIESSLHKTENIDFKVLLTRPETQKFDKFLELDRLDKQTDEFIFKEENIQREGRWIIFISTKADNKIGRKTLFINTQDPENNFIETDIFHTKNKRFHN
jgi:hypothetical protein